MMRNVSVDFATARLPAHIIDRRSSPIVRFCSKCKVKLEGYYVFLLTYMLSVDIIQDKGSSENVLRVVIDSLHFKTVGDALEQ